MPRENTQFKKGNSAAVKSGFYVDNILPCRESSCPKFPDCHNKEKYKDESGDFRCIEEFEFFNETKAEIEKEFKLDKRDIFQLPTMILRMIKLKRQNRYEANTGVVRKTLLINPVTGKEHEIDVPNVLNRDVYYAEKALMNWLASLKISRSARKASGKVDIFAMICNAKEGEVFEDPRD